MPNECCNLFTGRVTDLSVSLVLHCLHLLVGSAAGRSRSVLVQLQDSQTCDSWPTSMLFKQAGGECSLGGPARCAAARKPAWPRPLQEKKQLPDMQSNQASSERSFSEASNLNPTKSVKPQKPPGMLKPKRKARQLTPPTGQRIVPELYISTANHRHTGLSRKMEIRRCYVQVKKTAQLVSPTKNEVWYKKLLSVRKELNTTLCTCMRT